MSDQNPPKSDPRAAHTALRDVQNIQDALSRLRTATPAQPSNRPPGLPSLAALRRLYSTPSTPDQQDNAPASPRLTVAGASIDTVSIDDRRGPLKLVRADDPATTQTGPEPAYALIDLVSPTILKANNIGAFHNASLGDRASESIRLALARFEIAWAMARHQRRLVLATDVAVENLRDLTSQLPHMGGLIRQIAAQVSLQAKKAMPLHIGPLLLVGPAGLGKTYALTRIALAAGVPLEPCAMTLMPSAFAWFGSHRTWNAATYGVIARRLLETPIANPMFFVDEFDKAQAPTPDGEAYSAFYPLLERESAASFTDEFLGFPIDASHISWIFSANSVAGFPKPILDRLEVVHVDAPSPHARLEICRSIYRETNAYYLNNFDQEPTEAFLAALPNGSFRAVRRAIEKAMAMAAESNRQTLDAGDLTPTRRPPIALL